MNSYEIISHGPEETKEIGKIIGECARPGDVLFLEGKLGAGKTCLTQGIAVGLGIDDYILSPTFVIMREFYGRLNLYHMDLYRLDDIDESLDLGLDDYLYGDGLCVIEWAEKAQSILPKKHLLVKIDYLSDTERVFRLEPTSQIYKELAEQIHDACRGKSRE